MKTLVVITFLICSFSVFADVERVFTCSTINETPQSTIMLWKLETGFEIDIYQDIEMVMRGISVDPSEIEMKFDKGLDVNYKLLSAKIDLQRSGTILIENINSITTMISNHMRLYFPEGTEVSCFTN